MRTQAFHLDVQIPSPTDFVQGYPQYAAALGVERPLFNLIVTPDTFVRASAVTEALGLPAVAGIADVVSASFGGRGDWGFVKQLSGAIICAVMQANGYEKTGKKRAVSRPGWSKGEVYRKRQSGAKTLAATSR